MTFIEVLLDGGTMEIHGDGQQTRTFTYIGDTVEGFVRALETPEARGRDDQHRRNRQTSRSCELAGLVQEPLGVPRPLRARFVPYESLPGQVPGRSRSAIPDTTQGRGAARASRRPCPSRTGSTRRSSGTATGRGPRSPLPRHLTRPGENPAARRSVASNESDRTDVPRWAAPRKGLRGVRSSATSSGHDRTT